MKKKLLPKIASVILLFGVFLSLIPLTASAADTTLTGTRLMSSNPDVDSLGVVQGNVGLRFLTSDTGLYGVTFQSNGQRFLGIDTIDLDIAGPYPVAGIVVYEKQFGWVDQEYRLLNFGTGVSVSEHVYNWIINNSTSVDDSSYQSGYLAGLEVGLNSSDKRDQYYQEGYDEGFEDGLNSTSSSAFGQNLIGDTLSAPIRALNSFVLFTSPSGVNVSFGMIFGSLIALILFIAFLKMFAGG